MNPPEKADDVCCYGLVRVEDRISALEGWRVTHESSPAGMHYVTRSLIDELKGELTALRTENRADMTALRNEFKAMNVWITRTFAAVVVSVVIYTLERLIA